MEFSSRSLRSSATSRLSSATPPFLVLWDSDFDFVDAAFLAAGFFSALWAVLETVFFAASFLGFSA